MAHFLEATFMGADLLRSIREIRGGPALFGWSMAQIDRGGRSILITVRGLTSECSHPFGNICEYCDYCTMARMALLGTFNPTLMRRTFIFWGLLGMNEADFDGVSEELGNDLFLTSRELTVPDQLQLVWGKYEPSSPGGQKGWIEPSPIESLQDLWLVLYNMALGKRPEFWADRV